MSELENEATEIAAKPRKRNVTSGQLAKEIFVDINYNDPLHVPIKEVLDVLSANRQGFIKYNELGKVAQAGRLLDIKEDGTMNGTFNNLKSAYAEAIVLAGFRKGGTLNTAIYEPSKQSGTVEGGLAIYNAPTDLVPAIIDSFGKKTPDILFYSPLVETQNGNTRIVRYGSLDNIINPDNPTDVTRLLEYNYSRQSLVSPVEVTTATTPSLIKAKVDKFKNGYSNPVAGNSKIAYVPILVVDYDAYKKLRTEDKIEIVNGMKSVGGVVSVYPGLNALAVREATKAANKLTSEIRSRSRLYEKGQGIEPDHGEQVLAADTLSINQTELIAFGQEKSVSQENAAIPSYQKLVSAAQSIDSQLRPLGIDVINNPNHLNIMIATKAITIGLNPQEIFKQSPTYLSLAPATGELWINNIVTSAQEALAQPSITSATSQKIFQAYSNTKNNSQAIQQNSTNEFEKFATVVKSHASQLLSVGLDVLHNSKDLHVAIAMVAKNTDKDVKAILRQSPACSVLTAKESETLVNSWVSTAQSAPDSTHSTSTAKNHQPGGFQR
jgi:hypothetical protein